MAFYCYILLCEMNLFSYNTFCDLCFFAHTFHTVNWPVGSGNCRLNCLWIIVQLWHILVWQPFSISSRMSGLGLALNLYKIHKINWHFSNYLYINKRWCSDMSWNISSMLPPWIFFFSFQLPATLLLDYCCGGQLNKL